MAGLNGGFIGIDNEPVDNPQAAVTTTKTSTGTHTTQPLTTSIDFLVVGGGGGGSSGGGGAGGYRCFSCQPVSGNTPYPVVVGGGGAGTVASGPANGNNGGDTTFLSQTAAGGGGGSWENIVGANDGGSGGGAYDNWVARYPGYEGDGNTPPVSPSQGFPGGNGMYWGNSFYGSGGGGGAAARGQCGLSGCRPPLGAAKCGNGGAGKQYPYTGTYYAGGGGGGWRLGIYRQPATGAYMGGVGGGGPGGPGCGNLDGNGVSGTANTGGGGGAAGTTPYTGGTGGSGVVVIHEPEVTNVDNLGGMWNLEAQYTYKKAGTWSS